MAKESADIVRLSFAQNPAVQKWIQDEGYKPGDKCKLELELQFNDADDLGANFTVVAAVPEGYEVDENAEPGQISQPPTVGGAALGEPPMTAASMMVKQKSDAGA